MILWEISNANGLLGKGLPLLQKKRKFLSLLRPATAKENDNMGALTDTVIKEAINDIDDEIDNLNTDFQEVQLKKQSAEGELQVLQERKSQIDDHLSDGDDDGDDSDDDDGVEVEMDAILQQADDDMLETMADDLEDDITEKESEVSGYNETIKEIRDQFKSLEGRKENYQDMLGRIEKHSEDDGIEDHSEDGDD